MKEKFVRIRKDNCAYRIIDDEAFIITFDESILHTLNKTATSIWQLIEIEKEIMIKDIIEKIAAEFDISKEIAENDVIEFINELEKKKLVELKNN